MSASLPLDAPKPQLDGAGLLGAGYGKNPHASAFYSRDHAKVFISGDDALGTTGPT